MVAAIEERDRAVVVQMSDSIKHQRNLFLKTIFGNLGGVDSMKNPFLCLIPFWESGSKRHKLIFSIYIYIEREEMQNKGTKTL